MIHVDIQYFSDEIERIRYLDNESDMIDLRAAKDVEFQAGEFKLIPLGVAMRFPEGFEAHIYPKDNTYKDFGLIQANSVGIIGNNSYSGNGQWMYPAVASRDVIVHKNDRICQFRIIRNQPEIIFCEVKDFKAKNRGNCVTQEDSKITKIEVPLYKRVFSTAQEALAYYNTWRKAIRNL